MNPSNFSDMQSVRLASGVEMQQRWPMQQEEEQQKNAQVVPRLIEISPSNGNQGNIITVVVQFVPQSAVTIKLAFNSLVVDTKQMQAQGITSLVATVPPFQHINASSANVPVSVCIIDKDVVIETWTLAEFTYNFDSTDTTTSPLASGATTLPSTPSAHTPTTPSATLNTARGEDNYFNTNYNGFYQSLPQYNYSYTTPTTPTTSVAPSLNSNNRNQINSLNYHQLLNNTSAFENPMFGSAFDHTTTVSPMGNSLNTLSLQRASSSLPTTPTYYQKPTAHIPATSVANYQPYPGLISRANLKIMGDLDSMAQNWSNEEWEHRRRLVQFWREQDGNEIRCTFDPVSQSERISNNSGQIVVSCIYWAERNDCFITSVDCIHLLESLMDIRFSVEEKNRVRRNLEGFRPLTVSKCKAESADFFKIIMGFPNPKPRNIEKDVKVFPWKTLPYALKKIVTKYTASSYHSNNKPRPQLKSSSNYPSYSTSTPSVYSAQSYDSSKQEQKQQQPSFL